jgi:hypothetical protein
LFRCFLGRVSHPVRIQSAVAAALCRRSPKAGRVPHTVGDHAAFWSAGASEARPRFGWLRGRKEDGKMSDNRAHPIICYLLSPIFHFNPKRRRRCALPAQSKGGARAANRRRARRFLKCGGKRLLLTRISNPKGIVSSSPGLRGTSNPGNRSGGNRQPQRGCGLKAGRGQAQPRWGWQPPHRFPRVARASQPWALSRNPFGILQARLSS